MNVYESFGLIKGSLKEWWGGGVLGPGEVPTTVVSGSPEW